MESSHATQNKVVVGDVVGNASMLGEHRHAAK